MADDDELFMNLSGIHSESENMASEEYDEDFGHMDQAAYYELPIEDQRYVTKRVAELMDHFVRHGNKDFSSKTEEDDDIYLEDGGRSRRETAKKNVMAKVDEQLEQKKIPERYREPIRQQFESFKWGYYILDPLMNDPEVSDIKIYDYDHITYKKLGKRYDADVQFIDRRTYVNFVSVILIRNGQGQSNNNAIVKFTDTKTNPVFRLRFDILSKYVTSRGLPIVHIRLVPKKKRTMEQLDKDYGMFPDGTREYLEERQIKGSSFLITGKNGSGKTTLLNAMIDLIDKQKSVMVIEDNEELFCGRGREMMFTHSVESRTEGRITYGLSDLAEEGLLCDIDVEIVGEVKNDSAKGLMKAAYVGVQCFTTSHGSSATDGYRKLADYVKQATTYDLADCMRFLINFNTLVFMKNYKVSQIAETRGWDEDSSRPRFVVVYDSEKGGWIKNE